MSDLPELVVDGDPADWPHDRWNSPWPERRTVRVDDPLPTVENYPYDDPSGYECRPLRVGDRVELATECERCVGVGAVLSIGQAGKARNRECVDCGSTGSVPFATATVTRIEYDEPPQEYEGTVDPVWLVTVTDVEALP
jgi:RecJ-like exonuclease